MKLLSYIVALILPLITLVGCKIESGVKYVINIKPQVSCSFDHHTLNIEYSLMGITDGSAYPTVTATTSADWVIDIDCSEHGIIAIEVEANDGELRSTSIVINAPGHNTTEVKLSQLSAPTHSTHTLIFYFLGTSLSRYFNQNIEDAKAAIGTGILGDNNRVVFFRQKSQSTAYIGELCYDPVLNSAIERIIKDDIVIEGARITPEIVGEHLASLAKEAPADRYGLVLAGHGHGWITRNALINGDGPSTFSYGSDIWQQAIGAEMTRAYGEKNVQMDITELAEGIELSGVDVEYILFDACFMSSIEAIYDLRNVTDYIIASPCEIMGRGFPYHRTLPHLFTDGGTTSDLDGAAESYYKFYNTEYTNEARCGSIALYNCAELDAMAKATRKIVATAKTNYDNTFMQSYEGQKKHIFYDFGQWARVVATDDAALKAFNEQLERTVIAKYTLSSFYSAYGIYGIYTIDLDAYSGATTSAPSEAYPNEWKTTNWYKTIWE